MNRISKFFKERVESFKGYSRGKKIVVGVIGLALLINIPTVITMAIDNSFVSKKEIAEEEARQMRAEEASVARMQKDFEESQQKAQKEDFKNLEKEQEVINKDVRNTIESIIVDSYGSENVVFNNGDGVNMIGITTPGIAKEYVMLDKNNENRVFFENQAKELSKTISEQAIYLGSNEEYIICVLNDENRDNVLELFYNGDSYNFVD